MKFWKCANCDMMTYVSDELTNCPECDSEKSTVKTKNVQFVIDNIRQWSDEIAVRVHHEMERKGKKIILKDNFIILRERITFTFSPNRTTRHELARKGIGNSSPLIRRPQSSEPPNDHIITKIPLKHIISIRMTERTKIYGRPE